MNHLIVVAHPASDSFTMALARTYASELEALGQKPQMRDLYRMGFDPVLTAYELEGVGADHPARADVAQAQADLRAADVVTIMYPLWWLSMPAMMKGYIDRVFARGFAYESANGRVHGLLAGKQAVLVTVSGAPLPMLVKSGDWAAVQTLQDTHILRSAGFELLEHLHFDEVAPGLPAAVIDQHLERVRLFARGRFAPVAGAVAAPAS
ncbi:MAG: NAD(P)H-dependent oxidoreductase [Candidatus Lustribacter sp.]|jgi:NAD(P)H dehydrogenase (quinone)